MASSNVRQRGKIRHDEWPKIAERYRSGETLAEIARSYRCTAPAIRYIVGRSTGSVSRPTSINDEKVGRILQSRLSNADPSAEERSKVSMMDKRAPDDGAGSGIWSRINNDIATFLACMDALFDEDSNGNYDALLKATDRLLWASARTRLEIERVIGSNKASAPRKRVSG